MSAGAQAKEDLVRAINVAETVAEGVALLDAFAAEQTARADHADLKLAECSQREKRAEAQVERLRAAASRVMAIADRDHEAFVALRVLLADPRAEVKLDGAKRSADAWRKKCQAAEAQVERLRAQGRKAVDAFLATVINGTHGPTIPRETAILIEQFTALLADPPSGAPR